MDIRPSLHKTEKQKPTSKRNPINSCGVTERGLLNTEQVLVWTVRVMRIKTMNGCVSDENDEADETNQGVDSKDKVMHCLL